MPELPAKLQEIIDTFAQAERQEKVEMLIQYAESLPALPDWLQAERDKMDPVPECMTPVYVFGEQKDGGLTFHFDIPPQSPTVRGLAAILANGLEGCAPEEILSVPADFYQPMNLQEAVSQLRLNGFMGILAHMKQIAVRNMRQDGKG
jgi:cysteine desulfuration protein SufE